MQLFCLFSHQAPQELLQPDNNSNNNRSDGWTKKSFAAFSFQRCCSDFSLKSDFQELRARLRDGLSGGGVQEPRLFRNSVGTGPTQCFLFGFVRLKNQLFSSSSS